jgi:hypothetical protein
MYSHQILSIDKLKLTIVFSCPDRWIYSSELYALRASRYYYEAACVNIFLRDTCSLLYTEYTCTCAVTMIFSQKSLMYNNAIAIHHNCGNHKLNVHDCVKWATLSATHIPIDSLTSIKFKLVCEYLYI